MINKLISIGTAGKRKGEGTQEPEDITEREEKGKGNLLSANLYILKF
jgi:hypothetical protein